MKGEQRMSISNVKDMLAAYQYEASKGTNKTQSTAADFAKQLQNTAETGIAGVDAYKEYLNSKYGNVEVKDVGRDQKSIDAVGAGTAGTGNVVIAPNILEQMANDPEKAAYYEGKIQHYFDSLPRVKAELSAMGHEIHSSGVIIHPDGTVTHYISGDLKPEVRAKIEANIKAEQEEKAKRKKQYQELSEEAAEQRRLLMEQYQQRQMRAETMENQIFHSSNLYIVGQSQMTASAVAVYESLISSFSSSLQNKVRIL